MRIFLFLLCVVTLAFKPESAHAQPSDTVATASGLRYVWLHQANGKKPRPGSKVEVSYIGRLQNGTLFESATVASRIRSTTS